MCAKLLFHTGDWNCQTIEKQWSMVHIYGFFKSLKKKPLNWRNPTSQICSGMRSESKKRTLELSLIQGFSCVKSIYVLSLVVPPGIEPGTQGFSVLCSTNWAMAPLFLVCGCKGRHIFWFYKFFANFLWNSFWFQKNALPLHSQNRNGM